MTRYFMTIPEAARLVLQAGAFGTSGDLFVLDMGEPVRIVDLAREMIRLAGNDAIPIVFTGLQPGEKLHEVLCDRDQDLWQRLIPNPETRPRHAVPAGLLDGFDRLAQLADGSEEEVVESLATLVPEYTPKRIRVRSSSKSAVRVFAATGS